MSEIQSNQTIQIIKNYFEALAKRDLAALLRFFPYTPDWDVPGNKKLAPWLGQRSNRKQIQEFYEVLWTSAEPVSAEIEHIFADGDFGIATGQFSSRMLSTGKIYSSIFSAHFTIEQGLIVRYRFQEDSYGLVEALNPE